ncbi:3-methyladenine DNA glycosylase [Shewanella gelidii]|uniref:3-methyladenine DNA glycosylase n=1 Tax=Shewanella gelidii TaxID=1642821 RepID=A0A917N9S9_9GAMM|nr:DNA-3-methyladenine glycosylase I [Shewanella gelidii]GGI81492.1 3-methyladenine DNA glycosylase [Shewanella gelidii]
MSISQLESFDSIYTRACERKGGPEGLEALMPFSFSVDELMQFSDAELLSALSKQVFQSGFVWRVVELKWPQYEQAFFDFEPAKVLMLSPEQLQQRASDPTLIRHQKKTQAIYDNALMVHEIALEHGSFCRYIALWPEEEITQLWLQLKKRGARLGGNTAGYFLRAIGKDTFLLTNDIQGYLKAHQLVDAGLSSQSGLRQVQSIFNTWQQQSGRSYADISRILACSVGDNHL